jgi:hypothetical protein
MRARLAGWLKKKGVAARESVPRGRENRASESATQESAQEHELAARLAPYSEMIFQSLTQLAQATWGQGAFSLRAEASRHRRWVHAGIFGAEEIELAGHDWVAQPLPVAPERPNDRASNAEVGCRVYLLLDRQGRPARFGFGDDRAGQATWTWYREQPAWERAHETRDLSRDGLQALLQTRSAPGVGHSSRSGSGGG